MATRHVSHNTTYLLMSTEMENAQHMCTCPTLPLYTVYNLFMFMYDLFVRHQRSYKGFTDDVSVSCFHHQSLWSEVSGEALRFDMLSGRWLRLSDPIIQCNMTKLSMLAVSLKWIIVFTKCFHHIIILFELGKDKPRNHFHSPNRIVLKRFSIYYILEKYVCRVV